MNVDLTIKKLRRAWLAGLLNLIAPGLGFVYVGRLRYAILVPLIMLACFALPAWTRLIFSPGVFFIALGAYLVVLISSIIVAIVVAKRSGETVLAPYQRWYVYLGYAVICLATMKLVTSNRAILFGYDQHRFPTISMAYTLLRGDFVLSDMWAYRTDTPQRGDVVVFRFPKDPSVSYVKRVIGLPGDNILIQESVVFVNGVRLDEPYVAAENNVRFNRSNQEIEVPADSFFMLGDNRDYSNDSRFWGFVPRDNLLGKVKLVWMRYDPEQGLDASRMGVHIN